MTVQVIDAVSVKAMVRRFVLQAPIVAVAFYLLYLFGNDVKATAQETRVELAKHAVTTERAIDRREVFETRTVQLLETLINLERATCVNNGKDEAARQRCTDVR